MVSKNNVQCLLIIQFYKNEQKYPNRTWYWIKFLLLQSVKQPKSYQIPFEFILIN